MLEIRLLRLGDIDSVIEIAQGSESGMRSYWLECLDEQERGERVVLVARDASGVVGFAHLKWRSKYPGFEAHGIPEISDLRVIAHARRQGIATAIVRNCELLAVEAGRAMIGIGFGLYADYGPAQRLYIKLGYVPDGSGVTHGNETVAPGTTVRVDDDLILWLTKTLRKSANAGAAA